MRRVLNCFLLFLMVNSKSIVSLISVYNDISEAFDLYEVVPDVLEKAPAEYLTVKFPSGAEALGGNELTKDQVEEEPTLIWNADPELYYTLVMIDADAPSRQDRSEAQFRHWLVVNIPGSDVSSGETLTMRLSSNPPPDSGLHRYIFFVYQQPSNLTFEEFSVSETSPEDRAFFSIIDFAEKYNLGEPIAGNFYQTRNME